MQESPTWICPYGVGETLDRAFLSLSTWLSNPTFPNGINVGNGVPATFSSSTGAQTAPAYSSLLQVGPWVAPAPNAGWANFGAGFSTLGYRMVGPSVHLSGVIQLTGTILNAASSAIFTLPAAFRPLTVRVFSNGQFSGQRIDVTAAGVVQLENVSGGTLTNPQAFLDVVQFDVDA